MKLLFIAFYPNAVADFLMAPYVLKAYALTDEELKQKCEIDIVNFNEKKGIAKAKQLIEKSDYDLFAFSCYTWNIRQVLELSRCIDDRLPIIYGGPEISETNYTLFDAIQNPKYFVVGEGEIAFASLIRYFCGITQTMDFVNVDGRSHIVGMPATMLDLTTAPSIYQEVFPNELIRFREIPIETQRGCLYRCKYCNGNKGFSKIRYFSMERVKQDVRTVLENEPSEIRFIDSMFASDGARACEILNFLLAHCRDYIPLTYIEGDAFTISDSIMDIAVGFKSKPQINNCDSMTPTARPQYFTDMLAGYNLITVVGVQSLNKASLHAVNRRYQSAEHKSNHYQPERRKSIQGNASSRVSEE